MPPEGASAQNNMVYIVSCDNRMSDFMIVMKNIWNPVTFYNKVVLVNISKCRLLNNNKQYSF